MGKPSELEAFSFVVLFYTFEPHCSLFISLFSQLDLVSTLNACYFTNIKLTDYANFGHIVPYKCVE